MTMYLALNMKVREIRSPATNSDENALGKNKLPVLRTLRRQHK